MKELIFLYLITVNVVAFAAYGIDKYKARHQRWRISEATLLMLAAAGGAVGALSGMRLFHHKTKHKKFIILVPLFLVAWTAALLYVSGLIPYVGNAV